VMDKPTQNWAMMHRFDYVSPVCCCERRLPPGEV
jgi:hypothetical protein